jgi:hypothetical protein
MKTDELIDSLVQEARPVKPLPGVGTLVLGFVGAAALVALAAGSFRPRLDLAQEVRGMSLWAESAFLLLAAFAMAVAPARLSRPAARSVRSAVVISSLGLAAAVVVMGLRDSWNMGHSLLTWTGWGLFCGSGTILFSIIPFVGGIWVLRRGASVHPIRSGILLGLASGALGAIAEMWSCDINEPSHVISGHAILPGLILAAVGAWAGWRWLKW